MYRQGNLWTCCECGYRSDKKGNTFEHLEMKHVVHSGYYCEICTKTFKSKGKFNRHKTQCSKANDVI